MTVKKHLRAQEIALENRLPCIYLVDSGGAFLPLQAEVFPDRDHFGRIFYNQARMSAAGIPQVALVMGSCTAGGAYVPAMSDETVIVKGTGTIFLGGPPLVKAATGEDVTAEELGGAEVHTRRSGVADHEALDDEHALALGRSIVANLNRGRRRRRGIGASPSRPPSTRRPPASTARSRPTRAAPCRSASSSPGSSTAAGSTSSSRCYGETLVTGLRAPRRLAGRDPRQRRDPVQPVGAQGRPLHRARLPAPHPARVPPEHHRVHGRARVRGGGIAKDGAKLVTAVACAEVPKFTVLIGGSFGAGNYAMAGRAYQPRFLWTWPNARISVMGGPQAARVLSTVRGEFAGDASATPSRRRSSRPTSARVAVLRDRPPVGRRRHRPARHAPRARDGLEAALHAPIPETRFGVFRM